MASLHRITGAIGSIALTLLATVGAVSIAIWGLNAAGVVQPLIVVSGSMTPAIATGDLLISVAADKEDIAVGEVTTLRSADSGDLVTHRVVEVDAAEGAVNVRMRGDANNAVDAETYTVRDGDPVWQPLITVPGGGYVVTTLMRPHVAAPIVLGILALCALALFPARTDATPRVPRTSAPPASTTALTRREQREMAR